MPRITGQFTITHNGNQITFTLVGETYKSVDTESGVKSRKPFYLLAPSWSPPLFQFREEKLMLKVGGIRFGESDRIDSRIHSS